ncbi:hypothetical protein CMZ84_16030 [Lysobacteraceae bacterium NML93-0399]|nr:hypothetical protein CMZ84_16030 [Xanthomonadaceae bacterium NML93-0399]
MSRPAPRLVLALLSTAILASVATAAQAQSRDDRFVLRLSAFNPEAELGFSGNGAVTDGTDSATFDFNESFDTGREWRPRGAIGFRISERQALVGNYYDYRRNEAWEYGGNVLDTGTILPGGEAIEVPGARIDGRLSFNLASLNYEYAVVKSENFEWGLGLGVTYAELEAFANGVSTDTDLIDAQFEEVNWKRDGFSPGLHTRLSWIPADRWTVSLEAQYLDTRWGDFLDERGHFERGGLLVEYMISERIGIHAGYDWFRLKLSDDYRGTARAPEGIDAGPFPYSGRVTGDLKVHGPMAGVTFRF